MDKSGAEATSSGLLWRAWSAPRPPNANAHERKSRSQLSLTPRLYFLLRRGDTTTGQHAGRAGLRALSVVRRGCGSLGAAGQSARGARCRARRRLCSEKWGARQRHAPSRRGAAAARWGTTEPAAGQDGRRRRCQRIHGRRSSPSLAEGKGRTDNVREWPTEGEASARSTVPVTRTPSTGILHSKRTGKIEATGLPRRLHAAATRVPAV